MAKRSKNRCPLAAHYAPNTASGCIGCGKRFNPPSLTRTKARKILRDAQVRGYPLTPAQRGLFGAIASGYPLRGAPNPGGAKRIGRAKELRYDRDQGKHQGLYYHLFRLRKAGVWTEEGGRVTKRGEVSIR